jgi:hypothetical protein
MSIPKTFSPPSGAGVLASHFMPLPATFSFDCSGRRIDAAIRSDRAGGAELVVRSYLGFMPYSAESRAARQHVMALVHAASRIPNTQITQDRSNALYARRQMAFSTRPPPSYVVAGATAIVVSLKPLWEAMERCASGKAPLPVPLACADESLKLAG